MMQKEIAKKLGLSRGRTSQLVKMGMPTTSLVDANAWRNKNLKKPSRAIPILKEDLPVGIKEEESQNPNAIQGDDSLARLLRSKKAEYVSFVLLLQSSKERNPVAMRAAVHGWGEAKKRVSEAEMEHARYEETTRQTIRMDEVREFITTWFGAIRNLMDAMPSSLSARANPSDPECAKVAIQEGVDQIFVTIQKAEGEFK